jgi:hypothetical protein
MVLVLFWFHLFYCTVVELMVLSSVVEAEPVGTGAFWSGQIRICNNCTKSGSGSDLLTRKSYVFCKFFQFVLRTYFLGKSLKML